MPLSGRMPLLTLRCCKVRQKRKYRPTRSFISCGDFGTMTNDNTDTLSEPRKQGTSLKLAYGHLLIKVPRDWFKVLLCLQFDRAQLIKGNIPWEPGATLLHPVIKVGI
jgi:hypothetical protein